MKRDRKAPKAQRKSILGMKNNEINTQRWGRVPAPRFGSTRGDRGGANSAGESY